MLWPLCSEPFHGKLILTGPLTQFPSIVSLFCLSGHCPPPYSWSSPASTSELLCMLFSLSGVFFLATWYTSY